VAGQDVGGIGFLVAWPLMENLGPIGSSIVLVAASFGGFWAVMGWQVFPPRGIHDSSPSKIAVKASRRPAKQDAAKQHRGSSPGDLPLPGVGSPPTPLPSLAIESSSSPVATESQPAGPRQETQKLPSIPPTSMIPRPGGGRWILPPISLLEKNLPGDPSPVDLQVRARIIDETLSSFGVDARVVNVRHGPAVTRFGISPAPGVKVARILALGDDIALRLAASPIRLEAPVPGEAVVGIEVPNAVTEMVSLRGIMENPAYAEKGGALKLALGRDVSGKPLIADLAKMPHLLIAGATGSGKSVCINSLIVALLLQNSPDRLQLMLIDPKQVEMKSYEGTPHLLSPVITDMEDVVPSLRWVVKEMERRYRLFAAKGFRNLDAFNKATPEKRGGYALPFIVVVVDELADLMMTAGEDVERILCRLAQLARATGIHLVIVTQRPSVDVVTGLIKANFPTRIAFAVTSQVDSRTILDQGGAEKLVGKGDSLFLAPDSSKPVRLQGAYTSDAEIEAVVDYWKAARPSFGDVAYEGATEFEPIADDEADELYEKAEEIAGEHDGKISVSYLQRKLRIGYARAKRLREALERNGILESSAPSEESDEEYGF